MVHPQPPIALNLTGHVSHCEMEVCSAALWLELALTLLKVEEKTEGFLTLFFLTFYFQYYIVRKLSDTQRMIKKTIIQYLNKIIYSLELEYSLYSNCMYSF